MPARPDPGTTPIRHGSRSATRATSNSHGRVPHAIPPDMFPTVRSRRLGRPQRARPDRVEKPFGRSESARLLNAILHRFPGGALFASTLPRQGGGDTSSLSLSNSRSSGLESTFRTCDPCLRRSSMDRQLLLSVGSIRDVIRTTCSSLPRWWRWSLPRPGSRYLQDERRRCSRAMPRSTRRRSCAAVRRLPPEPASNLTRRRRRSPRRGGDRLVAVGRVPWYIRLRRRSPPRDGVSSSSRPPEPVFRRGRRPDPHRNLVLSASARTTASLHLAGEAPAAPDSQLRVASTCRRLGERREAYERLLGDAIAGSSRASPRGLRSRPARRPPALDDPGSGAPYFRGPGPAKPSASSAATLVHLSAV